MPTPTTPVLLPRPRVIRRLPGAFRWPSIIPLPAVPPSSGRMEWDLRLLSRALWNGPRVRTVPARPGAPAPITLQLDAGRKPPTGPEAYTLRADERGVRIVAGRPAGLAMAIRTLAQIVEQTPSRELPCIEIEDEPALAFRAVHMNMLIARPTLRCWEERLDLLAAFKVNAVILEYEDKFPFSPGLGIAGEDAYTRDEVRRIVALVRERGMEAIPYQQCFGHLEYALKHPRHAGLREAGRFIGQPCPLLPASGRFIRRLLDEVADLHEGSTWFGMGGDEVNMGVCPRCAAKARRHGISAIYMDFVEPLVEHMTRRGFRPILCADMFLRYYEKIGRLAGRVTLLDWNYGAMKDARAAHFWRLHRELTPEEFHQRYPDKAHPEHQAAFRHIFPKPGGKMDSLYTTRYLQDHGYEVVGTSSASAAGLVWGPNLSHTLANITYHCRSASDKGILGTLVTRHAALVPVWEPCWPGFGAAAACAWNPSTPIAEFEKDFRRVFWGLGRSNTLRAWQKLAVLAPPLSRHDYHGWPYDGAPRPRDVRRELKDELRRRSPSELAEVVRKMRLLGASLGRIAAREGKLAARNSGLLEYLAFIGALADLRGGELELIIQALRGRRVPPGAGSRTVREEQRLRRWAKELLGKTMTPASVRQVLMILFDGEKDLAGLTRHDRLLDILSH